MKISDAKPGDVLRDKGGDVWVIDRNGTAWCVLDHVQVGGKRPWYPVEAEYWGPFTRLSPEKDPTDAA